MRKRVYLLNTSLSGGRCRLLASRGSFFRGGYLPGSVCRLPRHSCLLNSRRGSGRLLRGSNRFLRKGHGLGPGSRFLLHRMPRRRRRLGGRRLYFVYTYSRSLHGRLVLQMAHDVSDRSGKCESVWASPLSQHWDEFWERV